MATYLPRQFAGDEAAALRLIADHPFATLVTAADGREPQISHVPLFVEDGTLVGHFARPNPHAALLTRAPSVAVFHGPHAYVSPRWYVQPDQHVPTWNYAVVHVWGRAQPLDAGGTRRALERLTALFEQDRWEARPANLERLVHGVVAFRLPIERLDVKFKMSQNRAAEDRAGVIAGLDAGGAVEDRAVAAWMRAMVRAAGNELT